MAGWQSRVKDLLYDGESVVEVVDVGTARVVVTSHRVLTFTPEMSGTNFTQVDRPNVAGVGTSAISHQQLLERGIRFGLIGGVLIVTGLVFDFGSLMGDTDMSDVSETQQVGLDSVVSITQQLMGLMQNLDSLLQVFGALALLLSTVLLGVYWYLREPTLVIEMAGDEENIHVPRGRDTDQIRTRLEAAILPDAVAEQDPDLAGAGDPTDANSRRSQVTDDRTADRFANERTNDGFAGAQPSDRSPSNVTDGGQYTAANSDDTGDGFFDDDDGGDGQFSVEREEQRSDPDGRFFVGDDTTESASETPGTQETERDRSSTDETGTASDAGWRDDL